MQLRASDCGLDPYQALIDAIPDSAVILDQRGFIARVNRIWRDFCAENGGDRTGFYLAGNYLQICHDSAGRGDELAAFVANGLSRVLGSETDFQFRTEYPCHSSSEKRWFEVVATSFDLEGQRCVLIVHRNITDAKRRQLETIDAEQNAKNLAAIVATMPDAVIGFDLDGYITSWNAAAERLYGYERSEVIGRSMEILFPENWPTRAKEYVASIITDDLSHFEVPRKTKAGKLRTIAVTAAPVRSVTGEIVGISNVNRDVTEKRQAEHRLRSVLNNLFAFVGVLELDGTLVEANRAPLDIAGLAAEDVLGKKFWDTYWWSYASETQSQLREACQRARDGELVRHDVKIRIAGGQLIWIDFQLAPLRDADGEIVNLIPSGIDISDRKATEEALRTTLNTFENLVGQSPFGVYLVDSDFRLAHVSDGARSAFANVRPIIGHDFAAALRILWPEPFASEAIARFRHTLETGEPYHSSSTVETRYDSGEREAYDWMIERITMPDGRPGVVCNFYDLSERQKYEEHIRLLMREVNHRAKNLLTVVQSVARQTARASAPEEFVERFSQRLLGLSASQDLIVQGQWDGVRLMDLVRSQLRHLGEEDQSSRIRIKGEEIIVSPAAAQGIGMALHELATNALKYGSLSVGDGRVSIEWETMNDGKHFQIRWTEENGPTVTPPKRQGFGQTVIERMAAISVGGEVELMYRPEGVCWSLKAPVAKIATDLA